MGNGARLVSEPRVTEAVDERESVELLLRDLRTSPGGLSSREVDRRLGAYGRNAIVRRRERRWPRELAKQMTHPRITARIAIPSAVVPAAKARPEATQRSSASRATTMTFAGIVACQVGTAFASRTSWVSLRSIGVFTNRLLLWGIAFELAFTAVLIYAPPLQAIFGTAPLRAEELALLLPFPFVIWGADELRRYAYRQHGHSNWSVRPQVRRHGQPSSVK